MTRLSWESTGVVRYELGVDRGVLYPEMAPGVSWNGLIGVNEDSDGGETTGYYHDGQKFTQGVASSVYKATITAYTCPPEFLPCIGEVEMVPGFFLTGQPKRRFGLCYRTLQGDVGYKLHLIYQATARASSKTHKTLGGKSVSPTELEWQLDAVPLANSQGFVPSAHFVVDSTETDPLALMALETYLYGNDVSAPAMPSLSDLVSFISRNADPLMTSPYLMTSPTLTTQA